MKKKADRRKFNKICKYVVNAAVSREKEQGKLDVTDFYVGAMAAMVAMGYEPPAFGIMGIMGYNRKMLGLGKGAK